MTKHKQLNPKEDNNKIMPISRRDFIKLAGIYIAGTALTATGVESAERIVIPKNIRYLHFRNAASLSVIFDDGIECYISDEFPPNGRSDDRPNFAQILEKGSEPRVYRGEKTVEPAFGGFYRKTRNGFVNDVAEVAKQIIKGIEPGEVRIYNRNYGSNSGSTVVIKTVDGLIIEAFDHKYTGITDSLKATDPLKASLLNNQKDGNILTIPVGHNLLTVKESIGEIVALAEGRHLERGTTIQGKLDNELQKLGYL